MAKMAKHKKRSRVKSHAEETNRTWFFNRCMRFCLNVAEVKKKRKEFKHG